MNLVDRARIEYAVQRYGFWLDLRGVRAARRRELRTELRSNLTDAAADIGLTSALFGIGSPKQLAFAAQPGDPARPRWQHGFMAATAVFTLLVWGLLATSFTILQTVEAAGVSREVEVQTFPWFGTTFTAQHSPGTINAGIQGPWLLLVLPLVAFLLASQPWRLLRSKGPVPAATADHT